MSSKYTIDEILKNFKLEKPKKSVFGNYRIEENKLIFRAQSSEKINGKSYDETLLKFKKRVGEKLRETDGKLVDDDGKLVLLESLTENSKTGSLKITFYEENFIAQKVKLENDETIFLGNLDTLDLIGRTVSYGSENRNSEETEIQRNMKHDDFFMLKLSNFKNSDFSSFKALEIGEEKNYTYQIEKYNRYSGRMEKISQDVKVKPILFSLDGKNYLSDCDKREAKYGKLRYFVSQIEKSAKTISDAYESLKPEVVRQSESRGLEVLRIGNVYAIPCEKPTLPVLSLEEKFKILAESSGYSLDESDIKYICGENYSKSRKDAERLLQKVPRKRSLVGRNYTLATSIELNGVLYATDEVESNNRATLGLKQWYKIVDAKGKTKTESDVL